MTDRERLRATVPEPEPEPEWLRVLRAAVARSPQRAVARRLGVSQSSISSALSGTRDGSRRLARRVTEVLMATSVDCPFFGPISPVRCSREQSWPFCASSPWRVQQWLACQRCPRRRPQAERQTQATKTTKTPKKKGGR